MLPRITFLYGSNLGLAIRGICTYILKGESEGADIFNTLNGIVGLGAVSVHDHGC